MKKETITVALSDGETGFEIPSTMLMVIFFKTVEKLNVQKVIIKMA